MLGRKEAPKPAASPAPISSPPPPPTLLTVVGEHAKMEGTFEIADSVEIAATGRVSGNIQTDSLVMSKGGFIEDPRAGVQAQR